MGRHTNLWRRGAIYWWRRRFTTAEGECFIVALSLGVADPGMAARLGRRVSVEADHMMTTCPHPAELTHALRRFALIQRVDLENRMYEDFERARKMSPDERRAFLAHREFHYRVAQGVHLVAAHFGPVKIYADPVDRFLAAREFSTRERNKIAQRVENGAAAAAFSSHNGVSGTPRESAIATEIEAVGYEANSLNIHQSFQSLAESAAEFEQDAARLTRLAIADPEAARNTLTFRRLVSRDFDDESGIIPPFAAADAFERGDFDIHVSSSIDDSPAEVIVTPRIAIAKNDRAAAPSHDIADRPAVPRTDTSVRRDPPSQPVAATPRPAPFRARGDSIRVPPPTERRTSLTAVVETLIQQKRKPPKRNRDGRQPEPAWSEKTARQVRGVAQLFAAVVGSDQLADIRVEHIAALRRTLDALPTNYGKSATMRAWSLDEILEYSDDLPAESRGRDATTINRWLSQLQAILKSVVAEGYPLPGYSDAIREQREREADRESPVFSRDEVIILARQCDKAEAPSLYWIPLLAAYTGARRAELAGLRATDVDIDNEIMLLVANEHRGLKTPRAQRRIPIHPELRRLGFLTYVEKMQRSNPDILFPDLRKRGDRTPLSDLFGKMFDPMLSTALPAARAGGKTFHSLRHFVNSMFLAAQPRPADAARYKILGHKSPDNDVNADVYSHFADAELRQVIALLPNVTAALRPRRW